MSEHHLVVHNQPATLIESLREHARCQPCQLAYGFLGDGDTIDATLTYAELDRRAQAIAATLGTSTQVGDRALLLYQPGLDFIAAFFGCLYAGVIAVPAYPPNLARTERTLPRLAAITKEARPSVVLTIDSILARAAPLLAQLADFANLRWLATDLIDDAAAGAWVAPQVSGASLAFLQFTSGSTATPKGVMVSHENLIYNAAMMQAGFEHTAQSTFVTWLPLYHDMGLIGNILQSQYLGSTCYMMAPVSFLQQPIRWLRAIDRYQAYMSGGPNFAYDLCVRKISPEQRAELRLDSWKAAFNGAEPVRSETLDAFVEAFTPCGFSREALYPCYGLAEATLFVSGGNRATAPRIFTLERATLAEHAVRILAEPTTAQALVSCGTSWLEQQIAIVDPLSGLRCAADQVGEIWVAGRNIGAGYWNRPQETAETFQAYIADTQQGPYMRTGDLGFMLDGELVVTGRMKDMIIINGRNLYPQDIEQTAGESHAALRPSCCAAFSLAIDGYEQLVVVAEVDRSYRPWRDPLGDDQALVKGIRKAVSEQHEVRVHDVALIKTGTLSKTSSGKVQRHAVQLAYANETLHRWVSERAKSKELELAS